MADNSEEEYLNNLLKELLESSEDSEKTEDSDSDNTIENKTAENSEDEDMAILSRMLMDDSNLSDEESEEPDLSDVDMDLSIDDLLNEALVENNQEESNDEPEITPIFSESDNSFKDLVLDDSVDKNAASEVSESTASEIVDEFGSDFFSDLQGLISSGNESTKVDENAFRQSIIEEETKQTSDNNDFSDLFALEEGMSIDDIPDENTEAKLTEEELDKILGISDDNSAETGTVEEKSGKKAKKQREKKEKKKREKKPKKQREPKAPKESKKASSDKPKEKKSFKEFISLFDDEDSDDSAKKPDENQALINELYNDKEPQEETKEKKPKKAKKVKPPKEKKKKTPKVKKAPETQEPVEKVYLDKVGVAIITVLVLVFLVGGYFGVSYLNYRLTINTAKNYYNICNYTMAYEQLSGIDIKARDEYFYEQVRLLMIVNQGNDSYNNYMELDMETEAIDALINAVGRKQLIEEQAEKYNVTDKVNVVYLQLLETLDKYGIDEARALDLYRMTNYEAYYAELSKYGGLTQ